MTSGPPERKLADTIKLDLLSFVPRVSPLPSRDSMGEEGDLAVIAWETWNEANQFLIHACQQQSRLEMAVHSRLDPETSFDDALEIAKATDGFQDAALAADQASDLEEQLAAALWSTSATTLLGIMAKLFVILKKGESHEGSEEFPWPQIRSILIDATVIRDECR